MTSDDAPVNAYQKRHSDAANRIADTVALHLQADFDANWNQYIAASMADGRSDGNVYPSPEIAARHQPNPEYCVYICMVDAISPASAETILAANRQAYNAGYRTSPDVPITMGDGGRLLLPLENEKWSQSGLILPTHLRTKRRTRR